MLLSARVSDRGMDIAYRGLARTRVGDCCHSWICFDVVSLCSLSSYDVVHADQVSIVGAVVWFWCHHPLVSGTSRSRGFFRVPAVPCRFQFRFLSCLLIASPLIGLHRFLL